MDKDMKKGIKIGFGFFGSVLALSLLLFGMVYAVGFHTANEVISGTFSGNYSFMNGNVGIGTTSNPTEKLNVNGSINLNNTIFVNPNGNVGIKTNTPQSSLVINGSITSTGVVVQNGGSFGNAYIYCWSGMNVSGNNMSCGNPSADIYTGGSWYNGYKLLVDDAKKIDRIICQALGARYSLNYSSEANAGVAFIHDGSAFSSYATGSGSRYTQVQCQYSESLT